MGTNQRNQIKMSEEEVATFIEQSRTTTMATLAWVRVTVVTQAKIRDRQTGGFPTYSLSVDVRLRPRW